MRFIRVRVRSVIMVISSLKRTIMSDCLGVRHCGFAMVWAVSKLYATRLTRLVTRPFFFICAFSLCVMSLYYMGYLQVRQSYQMLTRRTSGSQLILFWSYYEDDTFYNRLNGLLDQQMCPESNCRFTTARSEFDVADAVVFTPILHRRYLPKRAHPGQIYVMYNMEPPSSFVGYPFEKYKDQYNLTMTYLDHPDTDIQIPLGYTIPRRSNMTMKNPNIKAKTHMAAWVVSNCNATGLRWSYAVELSKYIQLDVFGQCGTMKCGKHCFRDIERKYKFYFAFEKCYCDQYLTEKVFRTLNYNIIPIVLGGANYSGILPEHSYIDVHDFKSPKHLAHYLKELNHDDEQYMEYFDWKQHTKAVDGRNKTIAYCRLCELLNDRYYRFKNNFDFEMFWEPSSMCLHGDDERRALHLL